jgi:hypothetical protein
MSYFQPVRITRPAQRNTCFSLCIVLPRRILVNAVESLERGYYRDGTRRITRLLISSGVALINEPCAGTGSATGADFLFA